ncbi:dipeptide ABC transporter ATP-binding protein [Streptomyces sp. NPDC002740]
MTSPLEPRTAPGAPRRPVADPPSVTAPEPEAPAAPAATGTALSVRGLSVAYVGRPPVVQDVTFDVPAGQVVALVGESGSGKSTTALAALGLLPPTAHVVAGTVVFDDVGDLLGLPASRLRSLRGADIGFVPQDPGVSLDPTQRIGPQVAETLLVHGRCDRAQAARRAVEILELAGLDDPARRARQYPHELSGGMRQRVLVGIAWACEPRLIIADEPTSALDVTVQRQILDHLDRLRTRSGTALLLVTHDLAVAADRAQHIVVLSGGRVVEQGPPDKVLHDPDDDYTRLLVRSIPGRGRAERRGPGPGLGRGSDPGPGTEDGRDAGRDAGRDDGRDAGIRDTARTQQRPAPLVQVTNLVKEFDARRPDGSPFRFRAVDGVSFTVARGETLALVGESGSGKSTTARTVMALERPTSGSVDFDGIPLHSVRARDLRRLRRRFQLVQQNPYNSLSPRLSVESIVAEPLRAFGVPRDPGRIPALLERVGLARSLAARRPAELSGGQRQRVAIARALALEPDLVVCDEPVSALDVTTQAQVLDLLAELQTELGLSYLFISHDLAVVRDIADRVAVMRTGRVVETGPTAGVFDDPKEEYTAHLLASVPGGR